MFRIDTNLNCIAGILFVNVPLYTNVVAEQEKQKTYLKWLLLCTGQ